MTAPDPVAYLDAVDARVSAATPGPWHVGPYDTEIWADRDLVGWDAFHVATCRESPSPTADADLIAHAPADLAAMSAALRAVLQRHQSRFDYPNWCTGCHAFYPCPTVRAIAEHLGGGS